MPTITLGVPAAMDGWPFKVSGTLSGYSTIPKLSFSDGGTASLGPVTNLQEVSAGATTISLGWTAPVATGALTPLSSANNAAVSTTGVSFTHPALPIGTRTTQVTDGVAVGSVSYTVVPRPTIATVLAELNTVLSNLNNRNLARTELIKAIADLKLV